MGYRGRQNGKVGMLRPTDKLMDHWGQFVDWLPSCSLNPFSCLVCFISFKIFKASPGCVLKVAALSSGDESRSPLVPGDPCWLPSASVSASKVSIRLRPSRCGWWRLCGANWGAGDIQNLTSLDQKVLQSTTQSIEWAWSWCFSSFEISHPRSWKCFQARAVLVKSNLPQEQQTNHIQLCLSNLVMQNVIYVMLEVSQRSKKLGFRNRMSWRRSIP